MNRLFFLILITLVSNLVYAKTVKSPVILLSIDGFSYDYLAKYQPKNLLKLAKKGTSVKLLPVYPSKTFPNHLSIITGVYPVNHGIIHNKFYHPNLATMYSLGAGKNNSAWLNAKPFWSFAEEHQLKTAVYFWPELTAIGQAKMPSYSVPYNKIDTDEHGFEQIINWLNLPTGQAPQFIAGYFSSVDEAGHTYGVNSIELKQAIAKIDQLLGEFIMRLQHSKATNANIIVVSDHGMVQINQDKNIKLSMIFDGQLNNLLANKSIIMAQSSTQLYLYFDQEKLTKAKQQAIFKRLQQQERANAGLFNVYQKDHYPQHWHLNHSKSIVPDIIIEASMASSFINSEYTTSVVATHGYDPHGQPSLEAILLASGPDIVQGKELGSVENIHIVPLLSQLLGLPTMNNIDGKNTALNAMIKMH